MKKAFTIVELLLYMGLLAIFLLVLTDIWVSAMEALTRTENVAAITSDGRYILARLAYDVGQSGAINYTLNGGNLSSSGQQLNSYATTVDSFLVTPVDDTFRVNLTITGGGKSASYQTTLGKR
ncbi:MAG: hypothetical protein UW73_C0025G0015 [Microgenomates group bacterium GW2011_GWB1_44_8]|nr:MAG: hypothetical protein UW73_C0025G0015 [Microgenomates group bacterium GW2011_GWB1_44_8]